MSLTQPVRVYAQFSLYENPLMVQPLSQSEQVDFRMMSEIIRAFNEMTVYAAHFDRQVVPYYKSKDDDDDDVKESYQNLSALICYELDSKQNIGTIKRMQWEELILYLRAKYNSLNKYILVLDIAYYDSAEYRGHIEAKRANRLFADSMIIDLHNLAQSATAMPDDEKAVGVVVKYNPTMRSLILSARLNGYYNPEHMAVHTFKLPE